MTHVYRPWEGCLWTSGWITARQTRPTCFSYIRSEERGIFRKSNLASSGFMLVLSMWAASFSLFFQLLCCFSSGLLRYFLPRTVWLFIKMWWFYESKSSLKNVNFDSRKGWIKKTFWNNFMHAMHQKIVVTVYAKLWNGQLGRTLIQGCTVFFYISIMFLFFNWVE